MADDDDVHRLAELIVEVLGIGERKVDRLAGDFANEFDIDLAELVDAQPDFKTPSRDQTRASVVAALVERAETPEVLLRAFVSVGSSVIAMLDEIYQLLATRESTTSSGSESFRFSMNGQDLGIAISPAFLEEIGSMSQRLRPIELGTIDQIAVGRFVGYDGGESYGQFPVDSQDGRRLLHDVMLLQTLRTRLRRRADDDPAFESAVRRCDETLRSSERLLARLERLVVSFAAGSLQDRDETDQSSAASDHGQRGRDIEHQMLRDHGVLGAPVHPYFEELNESEFFGVRVMVGDPPEIVAAPQPMRSRDLVELWGADLSYLGAYLGIVRGGLTLREDRWDHEHLSSNPRLDSITAPTPEPVTSWLMEVGRSAEAAVNWIDREVWTPFGHESIMVSVEDYESFLNLPLWPQRHLLFEIWVLCRTISTCEGLGWRAELLGMAGDTWELQSGRASDPAASLERDGVDLKIWREPDRGVTPDVTIATPAPGDRDLVVVEAKDRLKMKSGLSAGSAAAEDSALGTGRKYLAKLGAPLTWVCNHSTFSGSAVEPDQNYGDYWHQIRLAGSFGPGNVPGEFERTLGEVIGTMSRIGEPRNELVLVLDTTASMQSAAQDVGDFLDGLDAESSCTYSAILVGDHGEEYVIRPIAAYPTPSDVRRAIEREPRTEGGDAPEAIEDAMQFAAWQATGSHQRFVVVTDAHPHERKDCPADIDFTEQVLHVLASGASIWVVTDWLGAAADAWTQFIEHPGFRFVSLTELSQLMATSG